MIPDPDDNIGDRSIIRQAHQMWNLNHLPLTWQRIMINYCQGILSVLRSFVS